MKNPKNRTKKNLPQSINKDIIPPEISIVINKRSTDLRDVILEIQFTLEIPGPGGNLTLGIVYQKINIIGRWTNVRLPFPINSANNLQTSSISFAVCKFDDRNDRYSVPHNGNRTRVLYESGRQGYVTITEDIVLLKGKPRILGQRALYTVTME